MMSDLGIVLWRERDRVRKRPLKTLLCCVLLKLLTVWLVLINMTRGVCEVTLSCILCCSSYHVVVEEGQGCLQVNILPCQAMTAAMGRMSDDYDPAFYHLYPRSHLPPSKTLIILHFVVPVHASVIPCHHCMQRLLPIIIVVIAKAKGQLLYLIFFLTSFHSIFTSIKHLLGFF